MNTKGYVNYFEEIKEMDVEQQQLILEQARYHAFTKLKLSGVSALIFFGSLLLTFGVAVTISRIMQFDYLMMSVCVVIALTIQILVVKKLNAILLRKGLIAVLAEGKQEN